MGIDIEKRPIESGLVSALMVTKEDRKKLAVASAGDFHRQLYRHRELVVVIEPPGYFPPFAYSLAVCFERLALKLGELRTASVNAARGEFVAQWDDDDRSRPDRLSVQISAVRKKNADLCFLKRVQLRCLCGHTAISHSREGEAVGFWECTMLARRSSLVGLSYPPVPQGEDFMFVRRAEAIGKRIVTIDDPEIYTYCYHGTNTWSSNHFDSLFLKSTSPNHKPSDCLKETLQ